MRGRSTGSIVLVLLAGSLAVIACGSHDSTAAGGSAGGDWLQSSSSADTIDVSPGSQLSLALHGGLGPILSGQTITKASVTLSDLQLVDGGGNSVVLSSAPFTGDLVALQDQVGQIFSKHAIQAGSYTALRFRLGSAWIEAQDAQGNATVYASSGVDTSQFAHGTSVQPLQLSGLDADGFATCALPQGGIAVSGASSLALQFAFAQSLQVQSGGAWVLSPRCWLVDQSTFSTLDVQYEMSSSVTSYQHYWSSGWQVMLLDSNLYPVCEVPLAVYQSATFQAQFSYVQAFEGPFVAVLLPPAGYSLQSTVAFSVDVQQSASCSASVSVTSFQVTSGRSFAVGTGSQCHVVQRDTHGHVLAQTSEPLGAVEDVAPSTHHREPVTSGEQQPPPAQVPQLPGNPPPKPGHEHGGMPTMPAPTSTEHGMMPPPPAPTSTEHGMMPPPAPTSTEHGMTPPAPTGTSLGHEHGMTPPAPTSTSSGHERGVTPPAPSPSTTGTETPPPASTSTGRGGGRGGMAPPPPTTTSTAPPAPTGGPSGGRGSKGGGPTPSPSSAGPSPSGGGHASAGGPPATSGGPSTGGDEGRHGGR